MRLKDTQAEPGPMRAMFDTYLQLGRIETGNEAARLRPVDIGALLEDLADTCALADNAPGLRAEIVIAASGARAGHGAGRP